MSSAVAADPLRDKALQDYRKKLLEHKEVESRLKESKSFKLRLCFKICTIIYKEKLYILLFL